MALIVTELNFDNVIEAINAAQFIGLDSETTGLYKHHGDKIFSCSVSTLEEDYYFNFNKNPDHLGVLPPTVLPISLICKLIYPSYSGRIFLMNPVFDLGMFFQEGFDVSELNIYAVEDLARIAFNDRFQVGMAALAKDIGLKKMDEVKAYCKEHKLYEKVKIQGIKTEKKLFRFDLVPFPLISEYACVDTNVTVRLGMHYLRKIMAQDQGKTGIGSLGHIVQTGKKLIPILWKMKERGIKIDVEYCTTAAKYYAERAEEISREYTDLTGIQFVDSGKNHKAAFEKLGHKHGYTPKGNPSFTDEMLESMDYPLADVIRRWRKFNKKSSFFYSYLFHRSPDDIIHANLNQSATVTGRFSSSDPNLQQVPKRGEDKYKYPVRRAFIPRDGYTLFTLDFDQFEYRMMLNKAAEMGIIKQVLDGLDVHTATKNQMEIDDRDSAKTINFLLLYGGGIAVLARKLYKTHIPEHVLKLVQKYSMYEDFMWDNIRIAKELNLELWEVEHGVKILTDAKELRDLYFTKLPNVKKYIKRTSKEAERGKLYNYFGRCYTFRNKDFAYKAPNYEIQGETADWIKLAMVQIATYLSDKEGYLLLQVHDELILEVKNGHEYVVDEVRKIMENVAPTKYLPYTVGMDIAEKSWYDKKEYRPWDL